jgi:hypothetical protein
MATYHEFRLYYEDSLNYIEKGEMILRRVFNLFIADHLHWIEDWRPVELDGGRAVAITPDGTIAMRAELDAQFAQPPREGAKPVITITFQVQRDIQNTQLWHVRFGGTSGTVEIVDTITSESIRPSLDSVFSSAETSIRSQVLSLALVDLRRPEGRVGGSREMGVGF